jgi:formiminotetrahydrofolate cyclodeaminase
MNETGPSFADMTVQDFTLALASERPTPGGGSAAAVAAALGASLTAMVARISLGRPALAQHSALHEEALAAADFARGRFLQLATDDAAAYSSYREARRLPHVTEAESASRVAATREAARGAAAIPLALVQACHDQVALVERLAGRTMTAVASDLDVAVLLLESAARGAAANVLVNLPAIEDDVYSAAITSEVDGWLEQIRLAAARARERVGSGEKREAEPA